MKTRLTPSQRNKIETALANHERFRGVYHWRPEGSASGRRSLEKRGSMSASFKHAGHRYEYEGRVSCTCSHTEYSGAFSIDGERKDVRLFKNLLAGTAPKGRDSKAATHNTREEKAQ